MKINKILSISFLFLILLNLSVFAESTYSSIGGEDGDFSQGSGNFNLDLMTEALYTKANANSFIPLVADVNNDGVNEIVSIDGTTIKIYQGVTLTLLDGITDANIGSRPFMELFDIDGDGFIEIIVGSTTDYILIFKYNGTHVTKMTQLDLGSYKIDGDVMIKCGQVEECLIVFNKGDTATNNAGGTAKMYGYMFNSSAFSSTILQIETGATSNYYNNFCFPRIRNIEYKDSDGNGIYEYIFTYVDATQIGLDGKDLRIQYLIFDGTTLSTELTISVENNLFKGPNGVFLCSTSKFDKYFTSPLVANIDGIGGNGLETMVAMNTATDEFIIYSFYSDGNPLRTYPNLFQADGEIISNLVLADIWEETGKVDFCVLGYHATDEELNLLCASEQSTKHVLGVPIRAYEWTFDTTGYTQIADTYLNNQFMIHSAQHSPVVTNEGYGLKDVEEIVSSFGVFEIDWSFTFYGGLKMIYENKKHPSVLLSVDYEDIGLDDLIAQTSTNLWYIDDGFTNSPAKISYYYINPCITQAWGKNTSVEIRIRPTDINGDLVSARATLYYGHPTAENVSDWSANVTSGTTIPFNFAAADTLVSNGKIRLEARDVENPLIIDVIDVSFSVATNGVMFGDCSTEMSIALTPEELTEEEQAEQEVKDNLQDIVLGCDENGENCKISTGWLPLIAIIVIILSVWASAEAGKNIGLDSSHAFYLAIFFGLLAFVFCVWLGWIEAWILISMLVFSAVLLAFIFRDKFSGNSGGI